MEPRDQSQQPEVAEVISAVPIGEAPVEDVVAVTPGVIVARPSASPVAGEAPPSPSPLAGEGRGQGLPSPSPAGEGRGEGAASGTPAPTAGVEETIEQPTDYEPSTPELHRNGHLKHVLECMLFVSTEPLNAKQLAETLQISEAAVEDGMVALEESLEDASGLQLMRVAGGYQLCTRPEYADYCGMILQPARKKLSKAALETLAVVAYRQPCTQPEVEAVRGVSVDGVMKTLMDRGLVREAGRKQAPGRPILYATTPEFLEYFGLNDISELPDIDMLAVEEVKALEAQRELFSQESGTEATVEAETE